MFYEEDRKIKKSNLRYTRLIPFGVSRVSGAQLRGFVPGLAHQGCSGGESLATNLKLLGILNTVYKY